MQQKRIKTLKIKNKKNNDSYFLSYFEPAGLKLIFRGYMKSVPLRCPIRETTDVVQHIYDKHVSPIFENQKADLLGTFKKKLSLILNSIIALKQ